MNIRKAIALFAVASLVLVSGSAFARGKELAPMEPQKLTYKEPNLKNVKLFEVEGLKAQKIKIMKLTDARENKATIGKNEEKKNLEKNLVVTTTDDVAAYCTDALGKIFTGLGLTVVDSAPTVVVKGEVLEFFVTEVNTYKSSVALRLTFESPDGKVMWKGVVDGASTKFGRSYNMDNYMEALNGGLAEAVKKLVMEKEDFKKVYGAK